MIKKTYLTEVEFINGVDEFKSFKTISTSVKITTEGLNKFQYILEGTHVNSDSIVLELFEQYDVPLRWRQVTTDKSNFTIEVYLDNGVFNINDTITISYEVLDTYSSELYSVDYLTGTLYLGSPSNLKLKISCDYYNMIMTGKAATQLDPSEYNVYNEVVSINNNQQTYSYSILYNSVDNIEPTYTTPFIRNTRVNLVSTSDEESL